MMRSSCLLRITFATLTLLLLPTARVAMAGDKAKEDELSRRMSYWEEKLPFCTWDGGPPFPSKYDDTDNLVNGREPEHLKCNDGDSVLFNGLMCAVGDQRGCEAVKASQAPDGRWWRSPRKMKEAGPEGGSETTFSNDHSRGAMLYIAEKRDKDALMRWIRWIDGNGRYLAVDPRFCGDDRCAFKPIDCPLLDRLAFSFQEGNPICDRNPLKAINPAESLRNTFNEVTRRLNNTPIERLDPAYHVVVRGFHEVISALENAHSEMVKLEQKIGTAKRVSENTAALVTLINAEVNKSGYPRHGVAVSALFLKKYGGFNTHEVSAAASIVASKESQNAFFEYVANGPTERMLDLILAKCPSRDSDIPHARFQWIWERADSEPAARKTMYWDCLFAAKQYRSGPIQGINLPVPTVFDLAYRRASDERNWQIRQAEARLDRIEEIWDTRSLDGDWSSPFDPNRSPIQNLGQRAEERLRELEEAARNPGRALEKKIEKVRRKLRL